MIPEYTSKEGNDRGWKLAKWFRTNAKQLGIEYVIFDQKIWNVSRDAQGWRPMADRGSPNSNHANHVHVSVGSGDVPSVKPPGGKTG